MEDTEYTDVMEVENATPDAEIEYKLAVDDKVTIWLRTVYTIKGISQQDALTKLFAVLDGGSYDAEDIIQESEEFLDGTEEPIKDPQEVTQEILDLDTNETLWENN